MTPTPMDYSRLLRRMADRGMTQTELAKAAGIKPERMKQKLNSLLYFTLKEMRRICELLEIPDTEISAYFYTPKGDEEIPEIETLSEDRGEDLMTERLKQTYADYALELSRRSDRSAALAELVGTIYGIVDYSEGISDAEKVQRIHFLLSSYNAGTIEKKEGEF